MLDGTLSLLPLGRNAGAVVADSRRAGSTLFCRKLRSERSLRRGGRYLEGLLRSQLPARGAKRQPRGHLAAVPGRRQRAGRLVVTRPRTRTWEPRDQESTPDVECSPRRSLTR